MKTPCEIYNSPDTVTRSASLQRQRDVIAAVEMPVEVTRRPSDLDALSGAAQVRLGGLAELHVRRHVDVAAAFQVHNDRLARAVDRSEHGAYVAEVQDAWRSYHQRVVHDARFEAGAAARIHRAPEEHDENGNGQPKLNDQHHAGAGVKADRHHQQAGHHVGRGGAEQLGQGRQQKRQAHELRQQRHDEHRERRRDCGDERVHAEHRHAREERQAARVHAAQVEQHGAGAVEVRRVERKAREEVGERIRTQFLVGVVAGADARGVRRHVHRDRDEREHRHVHDVHVGFAEHAEVERVPAELAVEGSDGHGVLGRRQKQPPAVQHVARHEEPQRVCDGDDAEHEVEREVRVAVALHQKHKRHGGQQRRGDQRRRHAPVLGPQLEAAEQDHPDARADRGRYGDDRRDAPQHVAGAEGAEREPEAEREQRGQKEAQQRVHEPVLAVRRAQAVDPRGRLAVLEGGEDQKPAPEAGEQRVGDLPDRRRAEVYDLGVRLAHVRAQGAGAGLRVVQEAAPERMYENGQRDGYHNRRGARSFNAQGARHDGLETICQKNFNLIAMAGTAQPMARHPGANRGSRRSLR